MGGAGGVGEEGAGDGAEGISFRGVELVVVLSTLGVGGFSAGRHAESRAKLAARKSAVFICLAGVDGCDFIEQPFQSASHASSSTFPKEVKVLRNRAGFQLSGILLGDFA